MDKKWTSNSKAVNLFISYRWLRKFLFDPVKNLTNALLLSLKKWRLCMLKILKQSKNNKPKAPILYRIISSIKVNIFKLSMWESSKMLKKFLEVCKISPQFYWKKMLKNLKSTMNFIKVSLLWVRTRLKQIILRKKQSENQPC